MAAPGFSLYEEPQRQDDPHAKFREVRQGQVTEFLGALRCDACVQADGKCWIRESDEQCLLCTSKDGPCIFTRTMVRRGTKSTFSWDDLIKPEPISRPDALSQYVELPSGEKERPSLILNVPPSSPSPPVLQKIEASRDSLGAGSRSERQQPNEQCKSHQTPPGKPPDHAQEAETSDQLEREASGQRATPQWQYGAETESGHAVPSTKRQTYDRSLSMDDSQAISRDPSLLRDQSIHSSVVNDSTERHTMENLDPSRSGQTPPAVSNKHKRAKLDVGRRAEVSMVRSLGACVRCRLLKKTCSSSRPCDSCLKTGESGRFGQIKCIASQLRGYLPYLFAGSTTGTLSVHEGLAAFQTELSSRGQQLLRSLHHNPDDAVLRLASQCFDGQSSTINLERASNLLDNVDSSCIRHRSIASPEYLRSAILGVCYIMVITRAFLESHVRQDVSIVDPKNLDLAIQPATDALMSLFAVATVVMSANECFDVIYRHTAEATGSNDGT